jgi:hypothetical protein
VFGVDLATVKQMLALNSLDGEVKLAVREGRISPTAAAALSELTDKEQRAALKSMTAAGDVTVEAARVAAATTKPTRKAKAKARTNGEADDVVRAPPRTLLRKIIETAGEKVSKDFLLGIRFATGALEAKRVKGLTAILTEIGPDFGRRSRA